MIVVMYAYGYILVYQTFIYTYIQTYIFIGKALSC